MKEIREIFETVSTYCGMMFLDAKMPRCEDAKSLSEAARQLGSGATHVAHCDKLRRAAFTLAEVLITLGIIGVVAALTLPTLIQNHQKQVYVTQLKKAYSTLTNVYNELAAEQEVADWNQISCSDWYCLSDLLKHVKTIKSFEGCEEDWCNTYNSGIAGPTMVWGTSSGFITADGALFVFTCGSYLDSDYTWIVDVNGYNKGPNKPGRDIFQFALENLHKVDDSWDPQNTGNKLIPVGAKTDYGYKTNDYIGEWGRWEDCSATNLTTSCTAKVLIEGKMNY